MLVKFFGFWLWLQFPTSLRRENRFLGETTDPSPQPQKRIV